MDEYILVWKRKWSVTTWLFLFNRYTILYMAISQVLPVTSQVSNKFHIFIAAQTSEWMVRWIFFSVRCEYPIVIDLP